MPERRPTTERLEVADSKLRDPSFRMNKGTGNEVGYYVFDYPAKDELIVRDWIKYWQRKNNPEVDGFNLTIFDLYDIMISMLEQEGFMNQCFEFEKRAGLDEITRAVMDLLQLDKPDGFLVDYIVRNTPDDAIVLLSGVGKCFPIIRSHNILNNLHQIFDNVPVILLYPGKYDEQALILFDIIKDDNYYRAFRLVD